MPTQNKKLYSEEMRSVLENCGIPFAVYRLVDEKVRVELVSDGLVSWQGPGKTREDLLQHLNTNMYKNVHPEDIVLVATKAKEFAQSRNGTYDAIYREKLYGKDEYRTVHSSGYHRSLDGADCAVIFYDDVTDAVDGAKNTRLEFDDGLIGFLNTDKIEPFVIVDAETHELYMVSSSVEKVWKPVKAFDSGITFEDYFFDPNEPQLITIEEVLEQSEVLVPNSRTGGDLVLKASLVKWKGKDAIFHQVSEKTERYFDLLTGLPNKEYCRMRGKDFADQIRDAGGTPTVVYFDIVGMKLYNNANGFDRGQDFLVRFASTLKIVFAGKLVSRFGDDHFSVIADETGLEEKLGEVRRYIKGVMSRVSMDIRVGICKINESDNLLDACEKSIIACKAQKSSADSYFRYYDENLHKELILHNYVVNHIDEAIENGYIKVYYQPVVRSITETFCGMEALVRWIDPQYGFLNPGVFIGALEEARQIHKLDSYVIGEICKELRAELDDGNVVVPVSFNLSRLDFTGCDIFEVVERALAKYEISREFIRVEITESIMASDSFVRNEIERFRAAGYEVWMDDFGSGYSSLNTLKDYKFDELKIDMLFLSKFNDISRTIVVSMVRMAKSLGIKTLAEGVETREQVDFLREIGCEKIQGYFYGKPQPIKDTLAHMQSIGVQIENAYVRRVYSNLGRIDYLVDSPKAIVAYDKGEFRFIFVNRLCEEQFRSLGIETFRDAEATCNNPNKSVYSLFREFERFAYMSPLHTTFTNHGMYVFVEAKLLADVDGCHIYDLVFRNTRVRCVDASPDASLVAGVPRKAKTLLLAVSDIQNRTFLESIVLPDYSVMVAEDGDEVLSVLLEYGDNISLVVIEAALPKTDGFTILQKLREVKNEFQLPIIVVTDNRELAKESLRLGANHYIHTPVTDKAQVKSAIDTAVKDVELFRKLTLDYMEYIPDGVMLLDAGTGEIIYVNGRALDIFDCGSVDDFRTLTGGRLSGAVLPEDFAELDEKLEILYRSGSKTALQTVYRIRTGSGVDKRVYHVSRFFRGTPYGNIVSVFISENSMALKERQERKEAFGMFMESGDATGSKPYDSGYRSFLFWNLTQNLPVSRSGGVTFIPEDMADSYTYDRHYEHWAKLMSKDDVNERKVEGYTREKLLIEFANGRSVAPLSLSFNFKNGWFSIRTAFEMMADPDTGDVILKLQNENATDVEAYRELTDAVVMNLYNQIIFIDVDADKLLSMSASNGKPVHVQRTISESIGELCKLFQLPPCSYQELFVQFQQFCADGRIYGRRLVLDNGLVKFVRMRNLYNGTKKYIVTVSDITGMV